MSWGTVTIGRITLREVFVAEESINAASGVRTVKMEGQESTPPLTRAETYQRRNSLLGVIGSLVQVAFTNKPELDGFYVVHDANAVVEDYTGEVIRVNWSIILTRFGASGETDIESRLSGIRRANDFALNGESWHAPSIGHYSYYTGSSAPSTMTRVTEDGTITVYRTVPSSVSPRWGVGVANYPKGRVRITSGGLEITGTDFVPSSTDWTMSNGITRVVNAPGGSGSIQVSVWNGTAYETKNWNITVAGGAALTTWDSVTILQNEMEYSTIRLVKAQGPNQLGRISIDLSLRRGSRFVEGYMQSSSSATLSVHLNSAETVTNVVASGYVWATSNDASGNKFTAGSARTFTAHANGGVTKASAIFLDFYLGVVFDGTAAVAGDQVTNIRDQYIGVLPEIVSAVWR